MDLLKWIRYLVLLDHSWHDEICDSISGKSGITDSINHNLARIRIDSYNSLPIEKKQWFLILKY